MEHKTIWKSFAFVIVLMFVVVSAVILSSGCLDSGTEVPVTPKVTITPDMEIAKTFVNLLNEGEFEKAHGFFNKDVAEAFPVDKLNATWNDLIDQYGVCTGIVNISSTEEKGYEIVFVTCNVSNAFFEVKIVFDNDEKIAGFFFSTNLPLQTPRICGS